MNRRYNSGSTLVELVIALAVFGIIASPLLGMMVHFSKVNSMSKSVLYANWTVNNEYEELKGLPIPELLERWSNGMIKTDDFFVSLDLAGYEPGYPIGQANSVNIVAQTDNANNLICSLVTQNLTDYYDITSISMIKLVIEDDELTSGDSNIRISILNNYGNVDEIKIVKTNGEPVRVNIYTQGIIEDQKLVLFIRDNLAAALNIKVYERPLQYGNIFIEYKDLIYIGNQQLKTMVQDNISIHTYKTSEPASLLLYAKVSLYKNLTDDTPAAFREGIIKTNH